MKLSREDKIVNTSVVVLLALFLLIVILPFISIVATAIAPASVLRSKGMVLVTSRVSWDNFKFVFNGQLGNVPVNLWRAFFNSVLRTLGGATLAVALEHVCAYVLTFRKLRFVRIFNIFLLITMFIGGGMIARFLVFNAYHLVDTTWALVLGGCLNAYTVFIMKNFITNSIPGALQEAALLDGANEIQIYVRIILPLSVPIIATYWMFAAVGQWNDWLNASIYINNADKYPLMYVIQRIINDGDKFTSPIFASTPPYMGIRCAAIVIGALPMLAIYPFLQKYFVKGTMVGSVKE